MEPKANRRHLSECTGWLRKAIERDIIRFYSAHASRRRAQRGIERADVDEVLIRGRVVDAREDMEMGGRKWQVEGRDLEGRKICVILGIESEDASHLSIVTVYEIEQGNRHGQGN